MKGNRYVACFRDKNNNLRDLVCFSFEYWGFFTLELLFSFSLFTNERECDFVLLSVLHFFVYKFVFNKSNYEVFLAALIKPYML